MQVKTHKHIASIAQIFAEHKDYLSDSFKARHLSHEFHLQLVMLSLRVLCIHFEIFKVFAREHVYVHCEDHYARAIVRAESYWRSQRERA